MFSGRDDGSGPACNNQNQWIYGDLVGYREGRGILQATRLESEGRLEWRRRAVKRPGSGGQRGEDGVFSVDLRYEGKRGEKGRGRKEESVLRGEVAW